MATAYLADDPKHGRRVALEVLKLDLAPPLVVVNWFQEIRGRLDGGT